MTLAVLLIFHTREKLCKCDRHYRCVSVTDTIGHAVVGPSGRRQFVEQTRHHVNCDRYRTLQIVWMGIMRQELVNLFGDLYISNSSFQIIHFSKFQAAIILTPIRMNYIFLINLIDQSIVISIYIPVPLFIDCSGNGIFVAILRFRDKTDKSQF